MLLYSNKREAAGNMQHTDSTAPML